MIRTKPITLQDFVDGASRQERIREILRRLPIVPGKEGEVDKWATEIDKPVFMSGASNGSSVSELPNITKSQIIKKIDALLACATDLDGLLGDPQMIAAVDIMVRKVTAERERLAQDNRPVKGRPEKVMTKHVALASLRAYRALTGLQATVITDPVTSADRGPYLEFLRSVFGAIGIPEKSAESQARSAIRSTKTCIAPN